MVAETKTLTFVEGIATNPPTITPLSVGTASQGDHAINRDFLDAIQIRIKNNFTATADPTTGDDSGDGYAVGSRWINVSASPRRHFVLLDSTLTAAVWVEVADLSQAQTLSNKILTTLVTGSTVSTLSGSDAELASTPQSFIQFSNASLVSLAMITNPANALFLVLTNATGNTVTIKNESGATAAKRILTGTGADVNFENNASLLFVYDTTNSRWRVVGGSGGGGSSLPTIFGSRGAPRSIVAATGIVSGSSHMSTTEENQKVYIEGSAAGVNDVSANPQISNHTLDGAMLTLQGRNDANTVLLENGNGLSLNGPAELGEDDVLVLQWDTTNWVEISRNF